MASSAHINALNRQLRSSPEYAQWMQSKGINPSGPIQLSDQQRREFAAYLRTRGWSIPNGAEIDPAGNINENEGFGKQAKRWGPIAGGAAATLFGVPGLFHGLLNSGGAAAGAAGGALGGASMNQAIPPAITAIGGIGGGTGMVAPAAAAAAGGGILGGIGRAVGQGAAGGGMNAWQRAAIAGLVGGIPTLLANRGMSDEERDVYGILRRDLEEARGDRETDRSARALQLQRMQYQNPLYQAVSQLAMSRLPTGAQRPMGEF